MKNKQVVFDEKNKDIKFIGFTESELKKLLKQVNSNLPYEKVCLYEN